ncbi:MAG TPA: hypothetical protein VD971_13900 [Phycisphaerales bacterium]|nr:hypothetical protein [Phycisphaerales bacterium]
MHRPARAVFLTFFAASAAFCAVWAVAGRPDEATRTPPPAPSSTAIICNADEPGQRLLIAGRVLARSGGPVAGANVTVYNTDAAGLYNPPNSGTREPRIQGTVKTDGQGRFQVLTVRPGPYPGGDDPAHVHMDITAPAYKRRFHSFWFEGDPLITPARTERARAYERGHPDDVTVVARPSNANGVLTVEQVIELESD